MSQVARNLTDAEDGFLNGSRFLIHDLDPLFTRAFRDVRLDVVTHVSRAALVIDQLVIEPLVIALDVVVLRV